jgi:L-lactate dehydrogenase complex protein LldG
VNARDEVLARVRTALGRPGAATSPPPGTDAVPRAYRTAGTQDQAELLSLLAERLAGYHAHVRRATRAGLTAAAASALAQRGARRVVIPPGLEVTGADLTALARRSRAELIPGDGLPAAGLDEMDGVITGAAVAIAETGTIVLDGSPGQGRRVLTLIPDYHLCIIHADQVVATVPQALARLSPGRPLTWISGPSATSDIELSRVEGVHGPRTLEVILTGPR